jgi:uncharacterized protein YecE (DUF72 family)
VQAKPVIGTQGTIRTGMGGWSYEPWRDTFYPPDVPQRGELAYASRQVTAIEINSTFYRLQKPEILAGWRDQTPDHFMFTTKASRTATYRKDLTEARESVERFANGVSVLAPKLGAIHWQLPPSKKFERDELATFLAYLPREARGVPLRHALEVRHKSFMCEAFLDLARSARVAVVFADSDEYPSFADVTGDFIYGRLMRTVSAEPTGYSQAALEAWAERARGWASGSEPSDLPKISASAAPTQPRDVFLFFISGAKERAPLAARQLAENVS